MTKCGGISMSKCVCADCVFNARYCVNTPKPCLMCDCDLCEENCGDCKEFACFYCNQHTTLEDVNRKLNEKRR